MDVRDVPPVDAPLRVLAEIRRLWAVQLTAEPGTTLTIPAASHDAAARFAGRWQGIRESYLERGGLEQHAPWPARVVRWEGAPEVHAALLDSYGEWALR